MADPTRGSAHVERDDLAPLSRSLLDDPLGFIDADHARQRAVCRALRRLAIERRIEPGLACDIAAFLTHDLVQHHHDEEDDLFPLLLKRALPDDGLEPIIDQLADDHAAATTASRKIAQLLSSFAAASDKKVGRRSADLARDYAASEQRHLAIENAIVMVIARKRLKLADLQAMSRSMKARRGASV